MKISHYSVYHNSITGKLLKEVDCNIIFEDKNKVEDVRDDLKARYQKEFNCSVVIYFIYGGR